jgi:hypothetical protein
VAAKQLEIRKSHMNINLFPFTVLGIAYREWVAKDEDDSLDVMGCRIFGLERGRSSSAQPTCMRTEIEEKDHDVTA